MPAIPNLRIREACGSGDEVHLIINKSRTRLVSSGIARMDVAQVFKGRTINF